MTKNQKGWIVFTTTDNVTGDTFVVKAPASVLNEDGTMNNERLMTYMDENPNEGTHVGKFPGKKGKAQLKAIAKRAKAAKN